MYLGIDVTIKVFLCSFGCSLTTLAIFFWIIYASELHISDSKQCIVVHIIILLIVAAISRLSGA